MPIARPCCTPDAWPASSPARSPASWAARSPPSLPSSRSTLARPSANSAPATATHPTTTAMLLTTPGRLGDHDERLPVRDRVAGLVEPELAAAWKGDRGQPAEALVADRPRQLDALGL